MSRLNASRHPHLICLLGLMCLPGAQALAQEGSGQAEVGSQGYYLRIGSQSVSNISGLTLNFNQFLPDIGLLTANLSPAMSDTRFRTGDDFVRLKGFPWKSQHWTVTVGDFHLPVQPIPISFNNVYYPEFFGRGIAVEATHENRTFGFYFGEETISNTPRVVLRVQVPQMVRGAYFRQKIGQRLLLGARWTHFSNDLQALRNSSNLVTQATNVIRADTLAGDAQYTVIGPLKLFGESSWSTSTTDQNYTGPRNAPFSLLAGPIYETALLTIRANYVYQSAAYMPLLGYYLGDRKGPFAELKFRPVKRVELFGSIGDSENNVAGDPTLPTFRNRSESAGVSVQLPLGLSLNSQFTEIDLAIRSSGRDPWQNSNNRQKMATLSKQVQRHNLRFTVRQLDQLSSLSPQREHTGEIEDTVRIWRALVGGGIRMQNMRTDHSLNTLYYHGTAQISIGRFSAYANIESGKDLLNRTVFATNAISTTVVGGDLTLGKHWQFQAEAYRNNLITALNPESIFVLQGQGVQAPATLAALNQWSFYFRFTRKFSWGKAAETSDLAGYVMTRVPLKGSVEGFVMERLADGNRPAEGIPVSMDQDRTATTDAEGRFRFQDVPEGVHKIALALQELPSDFDPGKNTEALLSIHANRATRCDLDVVHLASISGRIVGPPGTSVENMVIRLKPGDQYTTPESNGSFAFYNVREGDYVLELDAKTLPQYAIVTSQRQVPVKIHLGETPNPVVFQFKVEKPQKPVRKVFEKN